jgi:hypothetical protein
MTSGTVRTIAPMFRALVICPDGECAEAFTAIGSLDELESLVCDCGCTLRVDRISEHDGELQAGSTFELVALA